MSAERATQTKLVHLTDVELVLLDGRCSEKVQEQVDAAHKRLEMADTLTDLSPEAAGLIADVITDAETNGLVLWRSTRARSCRVCGKSAGYYKFKSGPRKGSEDWKRPLTFNAVEMADRFVRMKNHVTLGCCADCAKDLKPHIVEALAAVRAQVPPDIAAAGRPAWKKHGRRECPKCGWAGHEGQMRRLRTMMGDGTYPGGCPSCEFESRPFSESFKILDGFDVEADR